MGYTTWKLSQQSKRASEGKEITALRERVAELETEVSRLSVKISVTNEYRTHR